jgi:hypothetical protein
MQVPFSASSGSSAFAVYLMPRLSLAPEDSLRLSWGRGFDKESVSKKSENHPYEPDKFIGKLEKQNGSEFQRRSKTKYGQKSECQVKASGNTKDDSEILGTLILTVHCTWQKFFISLGFLYALSSQIR